MQSRYDASNKIQYIKVCGILTLIVAFLGIGLAWFNAGDLIEGLHDYGSAILVMIVGIWFTFSNSDRAKSIGLVMISASIIFLLMGIRFL